VTKTQEQPAVELEKASTAAPRPELDWERDWQGRPRILPDPTWTPETAPAAWVKDGAILESLEHTRVTTFAEALQDSSALTRWKARRVVLGMGRRPDYVIAAASLSTEDRDRDALDDLAEKALEAAGPNAADVGTAIHALTDRIDRGEDLGPVPEMYLPTLDAYRRATAVLRFVEFECRTVCDELQTAGTPDRLGFCSIPDPDGVVDALRIIDTKTGRVDYSAGKFSTQMATYRRSRKYHPGTGARQSWEELHGHPVSRWGLVVHVPAGSGQAELLWLDLEHGDTGAEEAARVRKWRQGATAGALLRPVFARAPRPATTDGTCRGRKADGEPCGYKRKTKADGLAAGFCGRHADQAAGLERWLAENPGADPDAGTVEAPKMKPVQPSFSASEQTPAAPVAGVHGEHVDPAPSPGLTEEQDAAYVAGLLVTDQHRPNGHVMAGPGAKVSAKDGTVWVKVQRTDAYGWERLEDVEAAGGPELVRCAGSGLLVTQCACPVHQPGREDLAAAAFERAQTAAANTPDPDRPARELSLPLSTPGEPVVYAEPEPEVPPLTHVLEGLPVESVAYAAAVDQWVHMAGAPDDAPEVVEALERHNAARARLEAPAPIMEDPPEDDAQAQKDLADAAANRADDAYRQQLQDARDAAPVGTYALEPQASPDSTWTEQQTMDHLESGGIQDAPVGTYALDPTTEQNGNRRPVSGLQTPEDAGHALRSARAALFDQIDACATEAELLALYQRHASIWSPPHTDRAGARSAHLQEMERARLEQEAREARQLEEQRAREKPEAALLAAITTAPDHGTLTALWQRHGMDLWGPEHTAAANHRAQQLAAMAQL